MHTPQSVFFCVLAYLCLGLSWSAEPVDFAVDVKATVSDKAPHITLSWTQRAQSNITAQRIHRRPKGAVTWTKLADLPTTETSYADATAEAGTEYEYWMERVLTGLNPSWAIGYLEAGVKVPAIHSRGILLLVVDDTMEKPLAKEISQLKLDLAGDGWETRTIIAPRAGTAVETKALIKAAYDADPAKVQAVYLLGHVPVPYSGGQAPDGHTDHKGAWPADCYYGEMNWTWRDTSANNTAASRTQNDNVPGDGKFDASTLTNLVELQVGRVDLHSMTKAPDAGVSEEELLRRYLNKAHDFRHKQGAYAAIPRRSLIRDGFGNYGNTEPFAASGWATAYASVGEEIDEAGADEWFSEKHAGGRDYLWGYGCGPGTYESAATVGTTADFGSKASRVVFTSMFGSYHGDWDSDNNLMRSVIAGNAEGTSLGLACFWSGRPYWFTHPLGMGETLGYMTRLSMNAVVTGGGTYRPTRSFSAGIHLGLMGDPALRMHVVEPPRELAAASAPGTVTLSWAPSREDALAGYHVYRAETVEGPFVKLTAEAVRDNSYVDTTGKPGAGYVYLVRAMKLETVPGGSYYNLSTGSAVEAVAGEIPAPVAPENLAAGTVTTASVSLAWSPSEYATGYRLERRGDDGSAVSFDIAAAETSFTDTTVSPKTGYDYQLVAWNDGGESAPATLRVLVPAPPRKVTGYEQWQLTYGVTIDGGGNPPVASRGPATVDSEPAFPDLLKYALGLPADATSDEGRTSHAVVTDETGSSYLTFTYTQPYPAPDDLTYIVESCPNVNHWTTGNISLLSETIEGNLRTVTVKVVSGQPDRCFVRLRVERN